MNAIQRAIRRARRRLLLSRWLQLAGLALLVAFAAAVVVLALDKTQVMVTLWWVYPAIAGAAVVTATLLSFRGRPTDAHVATIVDDRLRLKDRLSTAIWAESIRDDPFADFVKQDAERTAAAISADKALRVNPGRAWSWTFAGWAVLAVLVVFVRPFDPFGVEEEREAKLVAEAQEDAAVKHLIEAESLVKEVVRPEGALEEADPQQAMRELMELTRRDLRNPQMKREAVAKISEAQKQLAEAYEVQENRARAQQNALSGLDTGESGPADRFADALRRGDYEQAQKELEALIKKVENGELSEQQKQALQNQLQNMGQQLQQMAQQAAAQQAAQQQQANQQLAQQGLSQQQVQQIQQGGYNQQQIQQALQQQGMSQQQAQQMAQQMSQQMSQSQAQGQNSQMNQGLGQSLSQMAQSLSQQGQGQQPGQGQGQQPGQGQGQGQGMGAAGYGAQQQLAQMQSQMQQMQRTQQAQQQMYNALHNLNASQQQGGGNQPGSQGGVGGRQWGTGQGGPPLGAEKNLSGQYQADARGDIKERDGRIIASWQTDGNVVAGEVTVDYNNAVTEARSEAERAVSDDRVPRRYHGAIKDYFDQLPTSPQDVKHAPAAPR